MKLSDVVVESLKGVLAHNTAQIMLLDKTEALIYLNDAEALFTTLEIDHMQVKEIILYARLRARQECRQLKAMYERYGIQPKVSGHGGSQVSLQTLIEIAVAKGDQ